jgi:hypothetical protein
VTKPLFGHSLKWKHFVGPHLDIPPRAKRIGKKKKKKKGEKGSYPIGLKP